jgi:hypothetical protein
MERLTDLAFQQEDELLRDVQACESRRSAQADDRMIGMLDRLNASTLACLDIAEKLVFLFGKG